MFSLSFHAYLLLMFARLWLRFTPAELLHTGAVLDCLAREAKLMLLPSSSSHAISPDCQLKGYEYSLYFNVTLGL